MENAKDYKGKKLIVLAGQDVHRKMVEASQELGVYTIVTDYLENSSAKLIADESLMISILDTESLISYCLNNKIDGIVNCCNDLASKIVQEVSEAMNWPNIATREQIEIMTNKEMFKRKCIEYGIDVVKEYTKEEINSNQIKYPVLVKPIDSRGSRGSTICNNYDQLLIAVEKAKQNSKSNQVLVEEYMMEKQELSITYMIIDGEPYLISVGDRHSGDKKYNVDKILSCMIQPSWFIKTYLSNVDDKVKSMLKGIGLKNTVVFMQGFVDGDTVKMFDPAIRFPGNEYERIFTEAVGVNPMFSIISYALTGKMEDFGGKYIGSYELNGKCAVQYMINAREGVITEIRGLDKIYSHPNIVYVGKKYNIGDKIENTGDTRHRVFDISFLVERNDKAISDVIDFVNDNLEVLDEEGRDMIVSKFSYEKVKNLYKYVN